MGGVQALKSSLFPEHSSGDESIDSTNSSLFENETILEDAINRIQQKLAHN